MGANASFDVVIVGAGPGGLRCAYELARFDKSVLILEKNPVVGPKVCAGGVRFTDFQRLQLPAEEQGSPIDRWGYTTVDREVLGQHQIKGIDSPRVKVRTSARVTGIGNGFLVVNNNETIRYAYLVGADGSMSIVRTYLRLPTQQVILSVQCKMPAAQFSRSLSSQTIHIEYLKEIYPWYLWVFPHKEYVAVGCACGRDFIAGAHLKILLCDWLSRFTGEHFRTKFEGFPINCDYQGYQFGNIFLVGDAAGLASYETGEGIHQALISGEEIAKLIIDPTYSPEGLAGLLREREACLARFLPVVENRTAWMQHLC